MGARRAGCLYRGRARRPLAVSVLALAVCAPPAAALVAGDVAGTLNGEAVTLDEVDVALSGVVRAK